MVITDDGAVQSGPWLQGGLACERTQGPPVEPVGDIVERPPGSDEVVLEGLLVQL